MTVIDVLYPERETPYGNKLVDVNLQKIMFLKIMGKIPDLERPSNYADSYFKELEEIVLSCLNTEPSQRPPSEVLGSKLNRLFNDHLTVEKMDVTQFQGDGDSVPLESDSITNEVCFNYTKSSNKRVNISMKDLQLSQGKCKKLF